MGKTPPNTASRKYTGIMHPIPAGASGQVVGVCAFSGVFRGFKLGSGKAA